METTLLGAMAAEASLTERIAAGDREAIGEVYDRHHDMMRRFARRLVGDEAVAEDLVHDVFVSLPSTVRRFRHASSLGTFLVSIALNHARHYVRAASRRRSAMTRLENEVDEGAATPEDDTTRRRLARALSSALDRLPVDQRVAFVLCVVEERSSSEVAEMAGVPEATVRTRVFHARKKLREILAAESARPLRHGFTLRRPRGIFAR